MTWHRHRFRHRSPPAAMRGMGCMFGGVILLTAIAVRALPMSPSPFIAFVIAVFLVTVIVATSMVILRRIANALREQDRLRRQLMADVAHELRTPLAILQGRIEGLLDGVYPRDDERLGELLAETQHLSRLVEDVRTLANAEAGALDLQKERVDLAELIRDTARSFDRQIAVDAPDELIIEIDPVRIREVLLNLVANAAEHAPEGQVSVRAKAHAREAIVRVMDDGPGIPAEELQRIFERFRKGPRSRGSGLGLSIARKLVVAHGGEIRVESTEGNGTAVTLTLPR